MSKLVLIVGVPGSGKTTLSRALAATLPALYICSDTITDPLCSSDRVSPTYLALRPRIYGAMYAVAKDNLTLGASVVIDAPHLPSIVGQAWRDTMLRLIDRTGANLKIIRLFCSTQALGERLLQRGSERDGEKLAHWQAYLKENQILYEIPLDHRNINTERPFDEQLAEATAYVDMSGSA